MAVVSVVSFYIFSVILGFCIVPKVVPRPLVGTALVGPWERRM